ncbi:hypothetical protein ABD68_12445 [Bacillus endophyticus]|uniref:hypothetical protein n=1 Tax=Priestia endophytica TaxID=135735 RepID=UPI0018CDB270|nr:hypothetical protein [Priestia endophytica]MBG9812375.1 hypothetical protein [Priestia endophytica]
MKSFRKVGQDRLQLERAIIEKYKNNEDIDIVDLIRAVDRLLSNYHNQKIALDEYWINSQEIEVLHTLLKILTEGIEELEDIN